MTRDDTPMADKPEDAREPRRGQSPAPIDRRALLGTGGILAAAGLAGCGLLGDSGGTDAGDCPEPPDDMSGPVPSAYEGTTSEADIERKPERLLDRSTASYQSEPNGDQRCARCSYYVEDRNGDCLGACVRVEGYVEPDGWCEYYRTQVGGGW